MEKDKKTIARKPVTIDPHRGVVYCDDTPCQFKKYHLKGVKNIYSVTLTYNLKGKENKGKKKVMRMDYGSFHLAMGRFFIETSNEIRPSYMNLKEILMSVSTFDGTKLINEDVLRGVEYGGNRVKNGNFVNGDRIGEEFYR